MNKGMLSQDEIDALLNGTFFEEDEPETDATENESELFSTFEKDALGEIGNISFGNSATALSTLLNQKVEITTPQVSIIRRDRLEDEFPKPFVAVVVDYTSGFSGSNLLVIHQKDASIIADLMMNGTGLNPPVEFGELQLSAVQEAMNQMMGSAATSMSSVFNKRVEISPPVIDILNVPEGKGMENLPKDHLIVKVSFRLIVGNLIDSQIMQIMPVSFAKSLVQELLDSSTKESDESSAPELQVKEAHEKDQFGLENQQANTYTTESWRDRHSSLEHEMASMNKKQERKTVQPAVFSEFSQTNANREEPVNLQMLFDIPLQVTVELGRTKKLIKEILELSPGSIIELDKLAGEPVDILVNNRLIAKGEVVVIEENFGVRVTDIISQSEILHKMK